MKTKTRSDLKTIISDPSYFTWSVFTPQDKTLVHMYKPSRSWSLDYNYESMIYDDTIGLQPISHLGLTIYVKRFRPVTHISRKILAMVDNLRPFDYSNGYTFYRANIGGLNTAILSYLSSSLDDKYAALSHTDAPGTSLSRISNEAPALINNMFKSDSKLLGLPSVNFLATIAEIRDVKLLPDLFTKFTRSSHDVSDKLLGTSFGLLPIYSDFKSLFTIIDKGQPAIDRWESLAMSNQVMNAHSMISVDLLPSGTVKTDTGYRYEGNVYYSIGSYYPYTSIQVNHKIVRDYKVVLSAYYIPHLIDDDKWDDLKRSLYGFDGLLSTAWELIPYSFVIDWFTNIGDLITQFENKGKSLNMTFVGAGFSFKSKTVHTVNFDLIGPGNYTVPLYSTICKETYYNRTPVDKSSVFQANVNYALNFSRPSTSQTILGSALLHQLLRS